MACVRTACDTFPDTKVADDSGSTIDDNEVTLIGLSALQVEKELVDVQPSTRPDGDTTLMTFEVRLNNLGPKPLVDVQLTEDLEALLGGLYATGGLAGIESMPTQVGTPNEPAITSLNFFEAGVLGVSLSGEYFRMLRWRNPTKSSTKFGKDAAPFVREDNLNFIRFRVGGRTRVEAQKTNSG